MPRHTHHSRPAITLILTAAITLTAHGADIYVSPTGTNTNPGTQTAPFATPHHAITQAHPGDTIHLLPGTYLLTETLKLSRPGTADSPITLLGDSPETTILDFFALPDDKNSRGIQLSTDYWILKNFTVQKAPDNGINILGSHNVLEHLTVRQNKDSGVQVSGSESHHPSHNLLLNIDSCENYDPQNRGENADGFALKFRQLGEGNILRNCRAWRNSDDGYDFWAAAHGVTLEGCWAFDNGIDFDHLGARFNGDGNGFKLGQDSGQHTLKNCLAFNNPGNGFDINGNARPSVKPNEPIPHGVTLEGNISYNNTRNFAFNEAYPHLLKNNLSIASKTPNTFAPEIKSESNSWDPESTLTASPNLDFLSTRHASSTRSANGTLPPMPTKNDGK